MELEYLGESVVNVFLAVENAFIGIDLVEKKFISHGVMSVHIHITTQK